MIQVGISNQVFEKLRSVATKRNTAINDLLEQLVDMYLTNDEYSEMDDPAIGLLDGPTDLSLRAKTLLREEIQPYSGWTQK